MTEHHPWILAGPWYRWPRQQRELELAPRATRPEIQKYDHSKHVTAFQADPQLSLAWNDDDFVYQTSPFTAPVVPSGPLAGKKKRFEKFTRSKTTTRKLFLDTHKRFYLVVCELHCDAPGFPRARRDDVCQAGFVVRRRYATYPKSAEKEAAQILKRIGALQIELGKLERRPSAARTLRRWESLPAPGKNGGSNGKHEDLTANIAKERLELLKWAKKSGAGEAHEGWIASALNAIGSWELVEDAPQVLLEQTYPLYPLIPHPDDEDHAGQRATIHFGVVPTGAADADALGVARYDDDARYEIRCFVRRHREPCPRTAEPNDCNGTLFWSAPSETYRLASHFDLTGTSNRPVTVQLPDFTDLAAQAAAMPAGKASPVKMKQPNNSVLKFGTDTVPPLGGSVESAGQICSFAIPLITIVAWFLLNLFLPIVVFVFGLWFLLKLKFCILPSATISASVAAELEALGKAGAGVNVDLGIGVAGFTANGRTVGGLHAALSADLVAHTHADAEGKAELEGLSNAPLIDLETALTSKTVTGPDFTANVEFEARVDADAAVVV
ncbi:MAG: hypothetical protein M3540_12185 [Actinomycetota bacterium]|nr:hypothetical protein [Actinomycetota bacterium]